jgi:DNA polymerase-3 subunit gamma/tau
VVETSEALRLNGLSAASTLEEMSTVLQRMAVVQTVGGVADDDTDPEASETARLAGLMPRDETQLLYSICLHGRAELGLAPDEYAALTMVLLRLLAFKPQATQPLAEKKTLNSPAPAVAAQVVAAPTLVTRPGVASAGPVVPAVSAPKLPVVQPWEDAPAPVPIVLPALVVAASQDTTRTVPTASPLPPGQLLHVRGVEPPETLSGEDEDDGYQEFQRNPAPALVKYATDATKIVAIPVHVQAESRSEVTAQQGATVLVPTEEGDFWHATVQQLIKSDAINAMVRELALQSQLVARDTDQWILRVERESLNQTGTRDRLTTALQNAGFGVKLVVEIGRVTDCPARRNNAASAEKQLAAEKIIFDDPFVQAMMRDFGAKIVPGSIKPI